MIRLGVLVVGLALAVLIPFLIWGDGLERWVEGDGLLGRTSDDAPETDLFADIVADIVAALIGVALLVVDLFLPIPASTVMAALGLAFGPVLGGAIATLGATLSGLLAYGLCRALGPRMAERLAGADGLAAAEDLFERYGGWLVAASRWPPILPEIVACLAGLAGMPFRRFLVALLCGAAPMGFVFATLGWLGREQPLITLAVSALAPLLLWAVVRAALRRGRRRARSGP